MGPSYSANITGVEIKGRGVGGREGGGVERGGGFNVGNPQHPGPGLSTSAHAAVLTSARGLIMAAGR